jgi:Arc/MetJ-type ribon-helix-helix transcriptional regulator
MDDLILRSAYFRRTDDLLLRSLAHDLDVSKSDLIRAAIRLKLDDWRASGSHEVVLKDLARGTRENAVARKIVVQVPGAKRVAPPKQPSPAKTEAEPTKQSAKPTAVPARRTAKREAAAVTA